MEIEVATPEQQANLDSMTIEQLEAQVSQEEGAAPQQQGEATGQPQGEAVGQTTQTEQPKVDAEPAWFTKFKEDNKRELASYRSLMGMDQKIPRLIEAQVAQRLQALQQAQQTANLSPEDQQAQAQLQAQQQEWQRFVDARADARTKAQIDALAGEYGPILTELKEQRQQAQLQNATFDLVKDVIPENGREVWEKVFEGVAKDIEAGKPGAIERFDRLAANPAEIALEMIRTQRAEVQGKAQQVTQTRQNQAQQAAQGVRTSAVQSSGKKSVAEMSQAELDKLSVAELEAALPEA